MSLAAASRDPGRRRVYCYPNFLNWREKVSNINGCIAEVSTTGGGVGREPSLLAR